MTKTERKEFEAWCNKTLKEYQSILMLDDFRLLPIEKSESEASESAFRYPYKNIQIRYSKEVEDDYKAKKYDEARITLMHELCHTMTDPLYDKALQRMVSRNEIEDERERLTDHIANLVFRLL